MDISEKQDQLREQMNKDRLLIITLKDKIDGVTGEINDLTEKVNKADGRIDTYKNLIRQKQTVKAGKKLSQESDSESEATSQKKSETHQPDVDKKSQSDSEDAAPKKTLESSSSDQDEVKEQPSKKKQKAPIESSSS